MSTILEQLEQERERIDSAIRALKGGIHIRRGGKRHLSAESRAKIAKAQKARWKKQKSEAVKAAA